MSSPIQAAIDLLDQVGYTQPADMSMEEIGWSRGLIVKYGQMDGSQGRILMNKDSGIITINNAISYQPKINYIIAHEIGHSQMHRHLALFTDTDQTLYHWYSKGKHETEANIFAAELLMPTNLFLQKISKKKLGLSLIEELANYFGASKTATFIRYKELGAFPLMIIFMENGMIKWKSFSKDFPYQWLELGTKLPPYTVAGDYYYRQVEEKKPVKVNAIEWFPDDFVCQRDGDKGKLWEQCFPSSQNSIVTCLWTA